METLNTSEKLSGKPAILKAATALFAEKGFEAVSVREISNAAQVNVAMVSYYFGSKESLYLACIENFAQASYDEVRKLLSTPSDVASFRSQFAEFLNYKMDSLVRNREVHFIILREMQSDRPEYFRKKIILQMKPFFEVMENFLEAAKREGFIKEEFDVKGLALMSMGLLCQPFLAERFIQSEYGFSFLDEAHKKIYIEQVANLFFSGVLK